MSDQSPLKELELTIKSDLSKAVIEGRTMVPFQAFVKLILQRRVDLLFKEWGKDQVIVTSELLTSLAAAPQDRHEQRSDLIHVSLGLGTMIGLSLCAAAEIILQLLHVQLGIKEWGIFLGALVLVGALASAMTFLQKLPRGEKLTETVEGITKLLGK